MANGIYIPQYLVGEDLTYAAAYAANRLPSGDWQNVGSTLALTRTLESVRFEEQVELQDIRAVNRRVINNVITGRGMGVTLSELLKSDQNYWNVLPIMWVAANYYELIIARGWEFWDVFVITGGLRDGVTDWGRNTCEMVCHPIDVGFPGNAAFGYQSSAPPVGT